MGHFFEKLFALSKRYSQAIWGAIRQFIFLVPGSIGTTRITFILQKSGLIQDSLVKAGRD
jgi:hypothetical protein